MSDLKQPLWRRHLRLWGANVEEDVDDELRFHLEMLVKEYRDAGLTEAEARRAAAQRFGDYTTVADTCNEIGEETERMVKRREWLGRFWQDVRFGMRQLRANPAISITALLTLALGIGANTAIFSVVDAVLLRPLPYRDADRLVLSGMSVPEYRELRERSRSFEELTVWASNRYTIRDAENPEEVMGAIVYPNFFTMLATPELGRGFTADEENGPVAVIGHDLWQRRYGGDRSVLGKTVNLNGTAFEIVGVMPESFEYPDRRFEAWVPFAHAMSGTPLQMENRSLRIFRVVARLKPGTTFEQAQADMRAISLRWQAEQPATNEGLVFELLSLENSLLGGVRRALWVVLSAVGLVLLIACVNVANLMLGSTSARGREFAVRRALGASRGRLVRQLLTESLILALLGGVAGLLLARWLLGVLPRIAVDLPRLNEITIDARILLFTLGVCVFTSLLFGLIPAIRSSRGDLNDVLKQGGRGGVGVRHGSALRSTLIAFEVAISVVIVVGAGLLVQSLVRVVNQDIGFDPARLVSTNVGLFSLENGPARTAGLDRVLERVAAVPGVEAVAGGSALPPQSAQRGTGFTVPGRVQDETEREGAYWVGITPKYFATLGTRIVRGREFEPSDRAGTAPVVIINESLARALFGDGEAIGRQMELTNTDAGPGRRTIVGIVGDVRYAGVENAAVATIYTPFAQTPFLWSNLMVRSSLPAERLARPLRQAIGSVDARLVPATVQQHTSVVSDLIALRKFITVLLGGFAALALLLAVVGIYGVIAYTVVLRSKEIGVRLALGANPRGILTEVVSRAVRLVVIGLAVGLIASFWLTRLLAVLLYNVGATDPGTFVGAGAIMLLAAVSASAIPALRAARVDPLVTLRE